MEYRSALLQSISPVISFKRRLFFYTSLFYSVIAAETETKQRNHLFLIILFLVGSSLCRAWNWFKPITQKLSFVSETQMNCDANFNEKTNHNSKNKQNQVTVIGLNRFSPYIWNDKQINFKNDETWKTIVCWIYTETKIRVHFPFEIIVAKILTFPTDKGSRFRLKN